MLRESLLARTLVELADTLVDDFDVVDLLTMLADRCVETLDISAAGILLASPDGPLRVLASTSDAMRVLELLEVQAEEGPCLDCLHTRRPVPATDLAGAGARWPRFAPAAHAAGFHSVQALPLRLRGTIIGALNLFHTAAVVPRAADVEVAQAFADIATIAILQHRAAREAQVVNEQLNRALNSRVIIEQAKGVLAEREGLEVAQAFERLRRHARNNNLRLADLAADVIAGTVAPAALDRPPVGREG
jgi:GAF domain-containing protein